MIPPMSSAKIAIKFEDFVDPLLPYMYHCHILNHEDFGGMMGHYVVDAPVAVLNSTDDNLHLYPNPVNPGGNCRLVIPKGDQYSMGEIVDVSGRVVKSFRISGPMIDIEAPTSHGLYQVILKGSSAIKPIPLMVN